MSIYHRRYNAHIADAEDKPGVSIYEDSFEALLESEAHYQKSNPEMKIRWVQEGYGEEIYHSRPGFHEEICETRRRTTRVVPESEYRGDPVKWLDEEVAA